MEFLNRYDTCMLREKISSIQKPLLNWYKKNARDLPWRHTRDPYKIWVSEIMLQQTQVATVIPYYERWVKRFPTLNALAKAPLDEVMKYWAGLGYYRRVKMLHQAAQQIFKGLNGIIPNTPEELLKIKGIGRYTAGAILSIAFQKKAPLVDGNVIRILTRIFAIKSNVASAQTLKKLWVLADMLVPENNPGDFNQAMMELGATICLPQNPSCLICPVLKICSAAKLGTPEKFPAKKKATPLEKIESTALILRDAKGQVLIQKQPLAERWGGLWMFPFAKTTTDLEKQFCISLKGQKPRLSFKHGFTKYSVTLKVYDASFQGPGLRSARAHWIRPASLSQYAFPSPHQKIAKSLLKHEI